MTTTILFVIVIFLIECVCDALFKYWSQGPLKVSHNLVILQAPAPRSRARTAPERSPHRAPRSNTRLRPRRARPHPRFRVRPVHARRLRPLRLPLSGRLGMLFPASSPPIRASRRPITTRWALAALSRRVATRLLVSPALPRHLLPHPTSLPASTGPLNFLSVEDLPRGGSR